MDTAFVNMYIVDDVQDYVELLEFHKADVALQALPESWHESAMEAIQPICRHHRVRGHQTSHPHDPYVYMEGDIKL